MARPVLYKMDASPPACAVMILSDILGVQLDCKDVDFFTLEHKSPEFLKKNPMGTIPVLEDGDFVLSESNAIMQYLLQKYGGDKAESLYPSDLYVRALVNQALYFNAAVFFVRLKVIALPTLFEGLQGLTEKLVADVDTAFRVVETYLERNQYIAADHLTIADLAVGTTANANKSFIDFNSTKYPLTVKWLARLNAIPAFKKYSEPGAEILKSVMQSYWEKNKAQN